MTSDEDPMQYVIFCYDDEQVVFNWTKEQDDAVIGSLAQAKKRFAKKGKLGPSARLMPTTTATTIRKGKEAVVIDGPFAETKEQLLGFYVIDCDSLEQAIDFAKDLAQSSSSPGSYEVRPLRAFMQGGAPP
jgi:hypothetical protein